MVWVFVLVEGWLVVVFWVKGKVRLVKGRWKGRFGKMKS